MTKPSTGEEIITSEWKNCDIGLLIQKYESGESLTEEEKIVIIVLLKWVHTNNPWPEREVIAMVEELKQIKNDAIDAAVAAAVIEYRGEIAAKEAEIDDLININESLKINNFKYAIGGGLVGGLAVAIVFFVFGR